jgi:acetate kinase
VTDGVVAELERLIELAPLHQPPALAALATCRARWPSIPNVACFDTAFHATIPDAARTYAIPAQYRHVVRQYGFHGLSYAWASRRVNDLAPRARRVLLAHLGGGQSLCGTIDGRSVFTTMGFTPLDGLVMGTRSGALDPGAVAWMGKHLTGKDAVDVVLERQSGLMGLCGTSDMREVHAMVERGDEHAVFAFDVWRHRVVTLAGAGVAAAGGIDAIAFTGGIGEHDPVARAALVDGLAWLGAAIDDDANSRNAEELSARGSPVRTFVIAAREDLQLAAEAEACF